MGYRPRAQAQQDLFDRPPPSDPPPALREAVLPALVALMTVLIRALHTSEPLGQTHDDV